MTNNESFDGGCAVLSGCSINAGTNTADLYGVAFQSGTFTTRSPRTPAIVVAPPCEP